MNRRRGAIEGSSCSEVEVLHRREEEKGVAFTQCRTRIHLWVPFVEAAIVSMSADNCDFFDWIALPSMYEKDIAIGRLRVKISTLNLLEGCRW
ncbi:uncharacterized protein G2W53_028835 [Senna tora]|uniref:Uncharacterized protein n=1 Tax=Senna tora TaxID=362788 RepID=A0A834WD64_9FABA|nr:uncharacterized protein G2W53_028835 [Senna tora]